MVSCLLLAFDLSAAAVARTVPLPVLMVGAGLYFAGSKSGQSLTQQASDAAADFADNASEFASKVGRRAQEISGEVGRRAQDLGDQLGARASAKTIGRPLVSSQGRSGDTLIKPKPTAKR